MLTMKKLKAVVLLISFVMFCVQLRIAIINLIDPPTVVSNSEKNISDFTPPLITVCPTNQTNITRLQELGNGISNVLFVREEGKGQWAINSILEFLLKGHENQIYPENLKKIIKC